MVWFREGLPPAGMATPPSAKDGETKRAHRLPDPAPAKQWTYEAWPQGWILALYGDVVWWCDLDTPMYRLQRAHAHLVFNQVSGMLARMEHLDRLSVRPGKVQA